MSGWDVDELRGRINTYPPYVGARIEVTHIATDASEIRVQMRLDADNANLVGTHFGGSLYAMVDPHLMILLMQRLGPAYVVWDRSAAIDFIKPGMGTVRCSIRVSDAEVDAIRAATASGERHLPQWVLDIVDDGDDVIARVEKTLHVRRRQKTTT